MSVGLPTLAANFMPDERAVLRIIADKVREHGQRDRTLGELAAKQHKRLNGRARNPCGRAP